MGWPAMDEHDDHALCREFGYRGLRLGDGDAAALALFGAAIYRGEDPDHGLAVVNRAVELNPNDLTALVYAGTAGMHWGDVEAAEGHYRRALKLGPADTRQSFVLGGLGRLAMMRGDFAAALEWARRGLPCATAMAPTTGRSSPPRRCWDTRRTRQPVSAASARCSRASRSTASAAASRRADRAWPRRWRGWKRPAGRQLKRRR